MADTAGKVAAAEGGTLYLDEIGELPLEIQPKLLRLLQEREYERVGETQTRRANVRIVSSTNRDLGRAIKEGRFREDLYYRLNVMELHLPPLRERPLDLERLAAAHPALFRAAGGEADPRLQPGGQDRAAAQSVARQPARTAQRHRTRGDPRCGPVGRSGAPDPDRRCFARWRVQ